MHTPTPETPWALRAGRDVCSPWAVFAVGSVEHRLRWIAPGRFLMGSPDGEAGHHAEEKLHRVTLTQGCWLGETPVTQELWRAVMDAEPSRFRGDRRPVDHVSCDDAEAFCAAVNARVEGLALSLPTEAEWEYACRAGTSTATWNDDPAHAPTESTLDAIAWYAENSRGETHDVGTRRANPWGLHDMLGNVWEWCADAARGSLRNAVDPLHRGERGALRVIRGGSWRDDPGRVRAAIRSSLGPAFRTDHVGFRVALGRAARP